MSDIDDIYRKKRLELTINDCKAMDNNYETIDRLMKELEEHEREGRDKECFKILNEINKTNNEITKTEKRIRTRLGYSY